MTYQQSHFFALLYFFLFNLFFLPQPSFALPDAEYISFTHENDLFSVDDRDRHYTSGTRLSFISDELKTFTGKNSSNWMRNIFAYTDLIKGKGYKREVVYGIGQVVNTPEVVSERAEQPDDLPYSGLLYWFYSMNGQKNGKSESITFMSGAIGPLSLSEYSQKLVHKVLKSDKARGWDHQLKNELALNIGYDQRYILYSDIAAEKWGYDLVGTGSMHLGNVLTGGNVSLTLVLGREGSFNPLSLRPVLIGRGTIAANGSIRPGPFFWVGAGTDIYLYSYFLDGNSFRDGPHVHKNTLVNNWFAGFGYHWRDYSAHIGWINQEKIFKEQKDGGMEFGSINITLRL